MVMSLFILPLAMPVASASSMMWEKTYGGSASDRAYSVTQTSDGGYALLGTTNSFGSGIINAWLVKTDSDGNILWNQTYSGMGQTIADSLEQTSDKGYIFTGYTYSLVEGEGGLYAWLCKTDYYGTLEWNQTYPQLGTAFAYSAIQTTDEGYALTVR